MICLAILKSFGISLFFGFTKLFFFCGFEGVI